MLLECLLCLLRGFLLSLLFVLGAWPFRFKRFCTACDRTVCVCVCVCVRAAMPPKFREASLEQTTTILAGYLAKPQPVESINRSEGVFVRVANNIPWLCQAVCDASRGRHPLKGITFLTDVCSKASEHQEPEKPGFHDPLAELEDPESALADSSDMLVTPLKKRARTKRKIEDDGKDGPVEILTSVRLVDVVADMEVFPEAERQKIEQAFLRVIVVRGCRGGKKMLYVWEKHVDLVLSILAILKARFGVPHVDLPGESALAEALEWFDPCTSRWHLRRSDNGEILVSNPVVRLGLNGHPLDMTAFQKAKADALDQLKALL